MNKDKIYICPGSPHNVVNFMLVQKTRRNSMNHKLDYLSQADIICDPVNWETFVIYDLQYFET